MHLISLSLALLAIVAGMFLLAKTKSENLGNFYKYVSCFVIIVGFLAVICIGVRTAMRCCHKSQECSMPGQRDHCEKGTMSGEGMMQSCCREKKGMGAECHKEMKKDCCKMMSKDVEVEIEDTLIEKH